MIVRIARVKVGHRQAPSQQTETPPLKRWGFCVGGYGSRIGGRLKARCPDSLSARPVAAHPRIPSVPDSPDRPPFLRDRPYRGRLSIIPLNKPLRSTADHSSAISPSSPLVATSFNYACLRIGV
jgi:hypothetical protein